MSLESASPPLSEVPEEPTGSSVGGPTHLAAPASSAPAASVVAVPRAPSIHFLGKDGWASRRSPGHAATLAAAAPTVPHGVTVLYDDAVGHPMYGRPPFSEEEVEALLEGGAGLVAHWRIKN